MPGSRVFLRWQARDREVAWGKDGKTPIREVISPPELARVAMVGGVEEIGGVLLQWLSRQPDLAPKRVVSPPKPYEAWNTRVGTHIHTQILGFAELFLRVLSASSLFSLLSWVMLIPGL